MVGPQPGARVPAFRPLLTELERCARVVCYRQVAPSGAREMARRSAPMNRPLLTKLKMDLPSPIGARCPGDRPSAGRLANWSMNWLARRVGWS